MSSNLISRTVRETLRLLWGRTKDWWEVEWEKYEKRDNKNFDKMFNKYFYSNILIPFGMTSIFYILIYKL